jgi:hypothetical protein
MFCSQEHVVNRESCIVCKYTENKWQKIHCLNLFLPQENLEHDGV